MRLFSKRTLSVEGIEPIDDHEYKITVKRTTEPSLFNFGSEEVVEYIGSGTVWNVLPDFERASTPMEGWLCSKLKKYQYENKIR